MDKSNIATQPTSTAKGKCHSLFVDKNISTKQNFRIFVNTFYEVENDIHNIWNMLLKAGTEDTLELRISSPGGLVTECQMYVNIMRNKFPGRTTTYIDSHASSAGAFTFSAGDKRVIYENSRIMYHNYSGGHQGTHQKMLDRMKFDTKHIIGFLRSTLKVGKKGFLTKKEYKQMVEGKEYWFGAEEMCKRGIATHIIVNGKELTTKEYLKGLKKGKKEKIQKYSLLDI